jgi:hypothetical protein
VSEARTGNRGKATSTHSLEMRRQGKVSEARTGDRKCTHILGMRRQGKVSEAKDRQQEKHLHSIDEKGRESERGEQGENGQQRKSTHQL